MRDYSVVLPRRVIHQPEPCLNKDGDCGPCVIAGLLGWSGPMDVYDALCGGKIDALPWFAMKESLIAAFRRGLFDRVITDIPRWRVHEPHMLFGSPSWLWNQEWFQYVRMALDAGYYAIAGVDLQKRGPMASIGADHWVLICGAREIYPPARESGIIRQEVLISCSARSIPDEEWADHRDFLMQRGGYNVLLVRPTA